MTTLSRLFAHSRVRMIIAGGISLLLSYASFLALLTLDAHYQIASVVNFVTYVAINFLLNRHWSFKSSGHVGTQALAHMSLHLGNQLMIMAGLYVLVELAGIHPAWSQIIMQVLATVAVFTLTPIIFRK